MRALPLLALAALSLIPASRAQSQARTDSAAPSADTILVVSPSVRRMARTSTERQILELERLSSVAYVRKDTAAFGRYLAPEYREFGPDGRIRGRAAALVAIANDSMPIASASLDTASIHVQGDAAIFLGVMAMRGSPGAPSAEARLWYTDTWLRRDGRWLLASSQFQTAPAGEGAMGYAPSNQSSLGASPTVGRDSGAVPDIPSAMTTAATLRKLQLEWVQAYVRRDSAALARIEAPGAVFVYPDGGVGSRERDIADIMSGNVVLDSTAVDSMEVRPLDASTSVVLLRATTHARARAQPGAPHQDISGVYRVMDVWQLRDGRWQVVAEQVTRIGPAAPKQ